MVHNPYWNAGGERRWAKEEDSTLLAMIKEGERYVDIAKRLRRTHPSVKSRIRFLRQTDEQRKAHRRQKTLCQPPVIRMKIEHLYERAPTIPPEVIEERNQRHLAPRSLTAILMGDPEPNRRRA